MTSTAALSFETPDQGEESARADLYGVLAALFYGPPSQALLDAIGASGSGGEGVLEQAWANLSGSCKTADADSVRDEYEALFIGVGKPEVLLYGSYYLSGFMMEKPLAELRTDLAKLGLQRGEAIAESEDHVAVLCEIMRHLITSNDAVKSSVATQKAFFAAHLQPWVLQMCDAVGAHPRANLYSAVARVARSFFEVEMQAFDMA